MLIGDNVTLDVHKLRLTEGQQKLINQTMILFSSSLVFVLTNTGVTLRICR